MSQEREFRGCIFERARKWKSMRLEGGEKNKAGGKTTDEKIGNMLT